MRLRRCHSSFKYVTCSRHSFVLICLFLIFFIVWALFICGIGEEIVKINHHYLWLILSSLCANLPSMCPPRHPQSSYLFSPEECPPNSPPTDFKAKPHLLHKASANCSDISSGNSSSTSGCLSLNWFSIIAVVIITSWVFPIALSTKFYTWETEYLLNRWRADNFIISLARS